MIFKIIFYIVMKNFLMYSGFDIETKNTVGIYYCFNIILIQYEDIKNEKYDAFSVLKSQDYTYIYFYKITYYENTYYYISKRKMIFKKLYFHNYFKIYDRTNIINKDYVF